MPRRPGSAQLARRIGARIRALRQEAGLTQEGLAWSCDLAKAYLSQIESGKRLPSLSALCNIARRVGVDPIDLLAIDPRNPKHALVDAVRRSDRESVESALRATGLYRHATPRQLRVAEATSQAQGRKARG